MSVISDQYNENNRRRTTSNIMGFTTKRKAITKADFLKVLNLMMRMGVSDLGGNWFGMVTADQYTDLLAIPDFGRLLQNRK